MAATLPTRETQIVLAIVLTTAAIIVVLFGAPSPSRNTGVLGVLFVGLSAGFIARAMPRRRLSSEQALFLVELGDLEGAAESALRTLRARAPGEGQARAWLILARCAELEADFTEEAALLDSARSVVDPSSSLAREIDERRAFALAALGRTREATTLLDLEALRQGPFRTPSRLRENSPLATRAMAMCLHRQGDHAALRELLDAEEAKAMHELTPRDRGLVRRIAKSAGRPTLTAFSHTEEQPEVTRWIERVLGTC